MTIALSRRGLVYFAILPEYCLPGCGGVGVLQKKGLVVLLVFSVGLGSLVWQGGKAWAGEVLEIVRANKTVRVGVRGLLPGFSFKDEAGQWHGLEVDLAKAVAAAVIEDPAKVTFVEVTAANRFPLLLAEKIDLLLGNTTHTFTREAAMGIFFANIYFFDGQAFMVPADSSSRTLADLNGAVIAYTKRTTQERNLADFFQARGWTFTGLPVETLSELWEALQSGRCQVVTADRGELAGIRMRASGGLSAWRILPEVISEEPLAAVVHASDGKWFLIVKWVIYALIEAEERGITRANVKDMLANPPDPSYRRFLASDGLAEKTLKLKPGWVIRVIESVGNYGEIYDRHFGPNTPLRLERQLNRLAKNGGLLYSPPFR